MKLKVVVCCRVHLYAEGLRKLLEEDEDLHVLGMAHNDKEIRNLTQYNPDIIITDLSSCREALKALPNDENKKVLLVDDANKVSAEEIKGLINEGLGGILTNEADGALLRKATQKLMAGELWFDRHTISDVLGRQDEKKEDIHLTKKETEILEFICTGLTNKEIANRLYISEQTVKSHCNHLFKKFGVSSRLKLAVRAPDRYTEKGQNSHSSH